MTEKYAIDPMRDSPANVWRAEIDYANLESR